MTTMRTDTPAGQIEFRWSYQMERSLIADARVDLDYIATRLSEVLYLELRTMLRQVHEEESR